MTKNSYKCLSCGDVLVSRHQRDFVGCSCGRLYIDGGTSCPRRGWSVEPGAGYEDLCEYGEEDG